MSNDNPGLPLSAEALDLLNKWVAENGLKVEDLGKLTPDELEAAVTELKTLDYLVSNPIKSDFTNPFWMEDEGYNDSQAARKVLRGLEEKLTKNRREV